MSNKLIFTLLGAGGFLALFFLNCSGPESVSFSSLTEEQFLRQCAINSDSSEDCIEVRRQLFNKSYKTSPTDILFVLDDSCSMNVIAENMALGFSSLQEIVYPDNTLMGLTYMAPAKVTSTGSISFSEPYHGNVSPHSPGYLRLVNKSTVDEFLNVEPSHSSSFPLQLCENSWFTPKQRSSAGNFCVDASAQLAHVCTGIEAGLVSLEHTLKNLSASNQRLFRRDSFVNIIFVSDTHEPGANYFGRDSALEKQRSFSEILSIINENSPGVSSVKFSGIVPLPVAGDPLYEGLNVIGQKPQNEEEAKINGEGTYEYSYLPYIKQTDGVAAHAKSSDWSQMAQEIIESSQRTGTILLELNEAPQKIRFVNINGEKISENDWTVSSDKKIITLKFSSPFDKELEIEVIYEAEEATS